MMVLGDVAAASFGCPEFMAAGDADGSAFLLVRAEEGANLRDALRDLKDLRARRAMALRLGATLARLHDAGFVHADLYAKHVLVNGARSEERRVGKECRSRWS